MMVGAGNNGIVERIFDADERVNACWYRSYAEISPCTHTGATYTVDGTDINGTHTMHCSHCTTAFEAEQHDFDATGECTVCHWMGDSYRVTIYLPDANDDDTYATDGVYKSYIYDMVAGTSFTLPGAPQDLQDMEFAGWLVLPTTNVTPTFSTYKASDDETLLAEKAPYILEGNVNFIARYKDIAISLADDSDNSETIFNYDGKVASTVTLTGRKLWKDGKWNTLCLPFSLTAEQIAESPLAGADIRTLSGASFSNNTLTLTFTAKDAVTSITAGTPYIVKWAATNPDYVENPEFTDVTISNSNNPVETEYIDFVGTYAPTDIYTEENTNLYLGDGNQLFYPSGENMTSFTINAFRAYFQLKNGITAGEPDSPNGIKAFVLNFGEETGIEEVNGYGLWVIGYGDGNGSENGYGLSVIGYGDGWFTLDGRRLDSKPADAGLYIYRGRKVLIK
jgi:hypothetical protein